MLGPQYRWLDDPQASFLHWHYACVAVVRRLDGQWRTEIRWGGSEIIAPCGSQAQGKRWVTRFFSARGAPSRVRRRPSQLPRRLFPSILG